ncbi:glutathione hydrolase 1 proenzyme-like isoform X2 [Condylostylus longicornis]|uniref:glutathione hydrolase 1 proenzyme-like isoform X2 n=1 Tax=Condylostylus longicornis TaxID=2530218 RepID=UPI00244E1B12|nr:glutathione hydrolase 1 proenzyme-like isoform X2 [Condylostylus longicornis]
MQNTKFYKKRIFSSLREDFPRYIELMLSWFPNFSKGHRILGICFIIIILLFTAGYLGLTLGLGAYSPSETDSEEVFKTVSIPNVEPFIPNPQVTQGPSASTLHMFANGGVCSDSALCSAIGKLILQKGGNVVDAAISALLCNGLTTLQSMGIGGGFLMNLYIKSDKKAWTIDAREVAPLQSEKNMFINLSSNSAIQGPLSIAVPGEIAGYGEALKHFGTMKWKDLIEPSIKICETGFKLTKHMYDSLHINPIIKNDTHLRKMFVNNKTNSFYPIGTVVYPSKELCQTYKILAQEGPESFYKGTLADLIADDLKDLGSIIVRSDLNVYHVDMVQSIPVRLTSDSIMYVIPPAGSGALVSHILNILRGYNMSRESISKDSASILTYHRIIEAFKFAYAKRASLGDLRFNPEAAYLVSNLTSNMYANEVRNLIFDNKTFDDGKYYGAEFDLKPDKGTSHLSFLGPNGDAVSVTSTINFYFGCGLTGKRTGIIFNSGMDDFSQPNKLSFFELPPSETNFIVPRKRALSSMSPTIITNGKGDVFLVIGAAGGAKIPSAVAQIIVRVLWFEQDIKQAIDAPRIHHQLYPNVVEYELGVLQSVIDGLEKLGHKTKRYRDRGSIACGIYKNETALYVNADYRKESGATGF